MSFIDSPAMAASQALQGLKQQLQQQHNELHRQRQSQERASSELGFYGNQQQVSYYSSFLRYRRHNFRVFRLLMKTVSKS